MNKLWSMPSTWILDFMNDKKYKINNNKSGQEACHVWSPSHQEMILGIQQRKFHCNSLRFLFNIEASVYRTEIHQDASRMTFVIAVLLPELKLRWRLNFLTSNLKRTEMKTWNVKREAGKSQAVSVTSGGVEEKLMQLQM